MSNRLIASAGSLCGSTTQISRALGAQVRGWSPLITPWVCRTFCGREDWVRCGIPDAREER